MGKNVSDAILDYLKRIDESINGPRPTRKPARDSRPLSDRVDSVSGRLDQLDKKIGTSRRNLPIAVQLDALDTKVDKRFDAVDRRIDATRDHVVDLITRVHEEVTKRVIDLEEPAPGRKGNGGRGSGGGGVPLAS
jgi:hypothetical protein